LLRPGKLDARAPVGRDDPVAVERPVDAAGDPELVAADDDLDRPRVEVGELGAAVLEPRDRERARARVGAHVPARPGRPGRAPGARARGTSSFREATPSARSRLTAPPSGTSSSRDAETVWKFRWTKSR